MVNYQINMAIYILNQSISINVVVEIYQAQVVLIQLYVV